ncbi:MAG: VWA domain-containing protein [Phycisphaerales bacterium]|nr:VWA domain-containing protein [Phycisphaerales bacterium]
MTWATPMLAALVAAIAIPSLVILYFLKLRRVPREVSSTLLWKKSIQDLQANAPFQKLRRNLLLFLQLIILGLILLALAQPRSTASSAAGRKLVLLIDRSASMRAVDGDGSSAGERTRLEAAKERAIGLVEGLASPSLFEESEDADEAMVIAFDRSAEIVSQFTSDKQGLINAINGIEQTDGPSSIEEAYRLAQSQRPNRVVIDSGGDGTGTDPVELEGIKGGDAYFFHLFSDGKVGELDVVRADEDTADAPSFEYHAVGEAGAVNVGLTALRAERDYEDPTKLSVFVGVQSTDVNPRSVDAELRVGGRVVSVRAVNLDGAVVESQTGEKEASTGGVVFELVEPNGVMVEVRLSTGFGDAGMDVLETDNVGTLIVPPAKQASVALVTTGSLFLREALSGLSISDLQIMSPAQYEEMRDAGETGAIDLFVFDGTMPKASEGGVVFDPGRYLVIGDVYTGPGGVVDQGEGPGTQIINWRRGHPLLRDLTLDAVVLGKSRTIEIPDGSELVSLAETTEGPAIVEMSTGDVRAVMVAFDPAFSNWPFDVSFVVFLASAVDYLGTQVGTDVDVNARQITPGFVLADRVPSDAENIRVRLPDGTMSGEVIAAPDGRIVYGPIHQRGVYRVEWIGSAGASDLVEDGKVMRFYGANLLDGPESDLGSAASLGLSNRVVSASSQGEITRLKEWWPWLLLGAIGVMMLEWWIYNKKVYL